MNLEVCAVVLRCTLLTSSTEQVARGRNLTVEQVEAVAKGRVWLGVDALRHKLVDGLGYAFYRCRTCRLPILVP
mgnify:CR=1 FL=1